MGLLNTIIGVVVFATGAYLTQRVLSTIGLGGGFLSMVGGLVGGVVLSHLFFQYIWPPIRESLGDLFD